MFVRVGENEETYEIRTTNTENLARVSRPARVYFITDSNLFPFYVRFFLFVNIDLLPESCITAVNVSENCIRTKNS